MESITRHVRDLTLADRSAIERVVGHPLSVDQRLTIQVMTEVETCAETDRTNEAPTNRLPEWCNVYGGMSDDELLALEGIIRARANLDRVGQ
jgi:hypothetical protein